MPGGVGIWLVYSRDAENRFPLVFADGRLGFFLFFVHCYLSCFMTDTRAEVMVRLCELGDVCSYSNELPIDSEISGQKP